MWVSRGGLPIGLPIGGYHHGTTRQAEGRHRARRREIGALGVRRHARGRAPGKQAHSQQGKRHRRALRSVPGRAGRRRPGPQHRLARAFARQARRDAARVPARARRARRLEAVRRRRQDRRARRDGHSQDGAGHTRRAACGGRQAARGRGRQVARRAKGLFDLREHAQLEQAPQHIARVVPGIRGASRPLGPGDPQAHGRRRRPMVDIRGLAAVRRGAHARLQARQSGGAGRIRRVVEQAAPGGRRLRGPRRPAARAKDIGERRRDRVADLRDIGAAFRRRDVQVPAHGARHRAANGIRAGHIHRHSRLPKPRQAGLVLRAGAAQPAVRHVDIVGVRVAAGQQEAEEPAHILLQLPCAQPQPMGRILRALPRQGHAARQGPEGRGEEAAQGDLRGHEGQGSVRGLTAGRDRRSGRACVSIAKNAHRKGESPLTEL